MGEKIEYGNKNIKRNSILSVIYKIISMLLSFVSAPLLLHCLGVEKYGIWTIIGSVIAWIYYSDLGIGSGLRNKLSISIAENNPEKSRSLVSLSYVLVTIALSVLLILAIIIVESLDVSTILNIQSSDENIKLCIIVFATFACINFVLSLVNNVLYAVQRASAVSFFNILGQGFFVLFLFVYSFTGIQIVLYAAIGQGLCQFTKNIIMSAYVFKRYSILKPNFKKIEFQHSKEILSFGILIFITQISSYIHNSTDSIIISKMFSAADVTPYSFCFKYFSMINSIYLVIISPLVSAYTVAWTKRDYTWVKSTMKKSMLLFLLFAGGTIVAACIFVPFSNIWLQQSLNYSPALIVWTAVYFIILMLSHNFSSFLTGVGEIKAYTIVVAIGALINIPVSVILAKYFGVAGVMLGSVISMLLNVIVCPYKTMKLLKERDSYK